MKRLNIRYRLTRPGVAAENGITLRMIPEYASAILEGGVPAPLDAVLGGLAALQGYEAAQVLSAAARPDDNRNDPLAGVDGWDPGEEDWVPGEDDD